MNYITPESKHTKLAGRALTLSVVSLVSALVCTVFVPFILSPIAIILSHISKGRLKNKHIAAQAATMIAIFALFLNCVIIGWSVYRFNTDSKVKSYVNQTFRQLYGMNVEEYTDQLLKDMGISILLPEQ